MIKSIIQIIIYQLKKKKYQVKKIKISRLSKLKIDNKIEIIEMII